MNYYKTPAGWSLLGDLTNDGTINLVDSAVQSSYWQETAVEQPGDLDRSGTVDIYDIALLLEDWLEETVWY